MSFLDDMEYQKMADLLNISYTDRAKTDVAEKVSAIAEWSKKKTGSDETFQQFTAVQETKEKLGINSNGRDLVGKLYQHIRLTE